VANLVIFIFKNVENFPSKAQNFHFLICFVLAELQNFTTTNSTAA
jgi:hypothetical protein